MGRYKSFILIIKFIFSLLDSKSDVTFYPLVYSKCLSAKCKRFYDTVYFSLSSTPGTASLNARCLSFNNVHKKDLVRSCTHFYPQFLSKNSEDVSCHYDSLTLFEIGISSFLVLHRKSCHRKGNDI